MHMLNIWIYIRTNFAGSPPMSHDKLMEMAHTSYVDTILPKLVNFLIMMFISQVVMECG